jgi:hypothetical protein
MSHTLRHIFVAAALSAVTFGAALAPTGALAHGGGSHGGGHGGGHFGGGHFGGGHFGGGHYGLHYGHNWSYHPNWHYRWGYNRWGYGGGSGGICRFEKVTYSDGHTVFIKKCV